MQQGPQTTGNVLVTIKAASKEAALEYARKLKNFVLDEAYGAIEMGNGEYLVRGRVVGNGPVQAPSE